MSAPVAGVLPVVHAAYRPDGELDEAAIRRVAAWALDAGADGLVMALASDLLRLRADERVRLGRWLVEAARGRPVVLSVGSESAAQAVWYAREAVAAGATALMAIPPVASAAPEAALEGYFGAILEATPLPLVVQDASGYLGRPLSPAFLTGLARRHGPDRIWFKPEGDRVGDVIEALREATGGRARIFEGSGGAELRAHVPRGIAGTMPGCDFVDGIVALWRALRRGDAAVAGRIGPAVEALAVLEGRAGLDGYLGLERHLLVRRGLIPSDRPRPPVAWEPDAESRAQADRLWQTLQEALA